MQLALEEGAKGLGRTAPNPPVGCVIVSKDGDVIGLGHHAKSGGDHAEVAALKSVKDPAQLKDSTFYVTLEPCSSQGKTPSCAHHLAGLPLKRVVFGLRDPNPGMAGGQKVLTDAGVSCDHLLQMQKPCLELAEVFVVNQVCNRSFVHVKVGASLDGQVALKSGESQWITSEPSRQHVHTLRGITDAVLIGRATFDCDNPSLNIRSGPYMDKTNAVVILDPGGKVLNQLPGSRLLDVRPAEKVFVVVSDTLSIKDEGRCRLIPVPMSDGHLNLHSALQQLMANGVLSVLVEGGGRTVSGFFHQNLVDRLTVFLAPKIVGAAGGQSWTKDLSIESLDNAICLPEWNVTQFGSDLCLSSGLFTDARLKDLKIS